MRFIRYRAGINAGNSNLINSKSVEMKGIYDKDSDTIRRIHGSFFLGYSVTEELYSLSDVTVIAPVTPYTIICLDKINGNGSESYLKSASSLGGTGGCVGIYSDMNGVYCSPRLAYVIEPRGKTKIFGYTLMLDFCTDISTRSYRDSGVNYTILGDYVYIGVLSSSSDARLMLNGNAVVETKAEVCESIEDIINKDIFNEITLLSGDIVATSVLSDKILCQRGDEIEFTYLGMKVFATIG